MIEILPPIYSNELFYGWISRYRTISGNSNKSTVYNLFNIENKVQFSVHYPHYLEYFCSNISKHFNITPEETIKKHTIVPLFKPFIDESEYQNIITSFIKEEYTTMSKRHIDFKSKYKIQKLYFCKECYKEHYEKYGEYYINRIHQITCNQICRKHLIKLSEFEVPSNVGKSELVDINDYDLDNDYSRKFNKRRTN